MIRKSCFEITATIIKNYYVGKPIEVVFEGAQDEYAELESVCKEENVRQKIILSRSQLYLENARFIQSEARETFEKVHPIIEKIVRKAIFPQIKAPGIRLALMTPLLRDRVKMQIRSGNTILSKTYIKCLPGQSTPGVR